MRRLWAWLFERRDPTVDQVLHNSTHSVAPRDWCNAEMALGQWCKHWHVADSYVWYENSTYEIYWTNHWRERHGWPYGLPNGATYREPSL